MNHHLPSEKNSKLLVEGKIRFTMKINQKRKEVKSSDFSGLHSCKYGTESYVFTLHFLLLVMIMWKMQNRNKTRITHLRIYFQFDTS